MEYKAEPIIVNAGGNPLNINSLDNVFDNGVNKDSIRLAGELAKKHLFFRIDCRCFSAFFKPLCLVENDDKPNKFIKEFLNKNLNTKSFKETPFGFIVDNKKTKQYISRYIAGIDPYDIENDSKSKGGVIT